jgi:hypothetical protein
MLERPPTRRQQAAARKRRWKARQRRGEAVYAVIADELALAHALIKSERLTEAETARRDLVERALAALVADFAAQWR